jgi:O-acetyl-ADP-ribose deacetylase (regulator of RNase III)
MTTSCAAVPGDITTFPVDAIVNAANSSLMGGGGVDGAIHRAGGPAIVTQCREIVARQGALRPGDAVLTGAGELPCRFVVHTVGPIWGRIPDGEADATLASAYERSMEVAEAAGCRSIAFPNISTGVFGFPTARAADVAVESVRHYVAAGTSIESILFVCHDAENLQLYRRKLAC